MTGSLKSKTINLEDGARVLPVSSILCDDEEEDYTERIVEAAPPVVESQDPTMVFCEGVMTIVLSKLDVRSLAISRSVNSKWLTLASTDQVWGLKRDELWRGKAHIPRISKVAGLSKMEATKLSIMDAKRNIITRNDLCDHEWDLRYTPAVPNQPDLDLAPMRRYFHPDGRITTGEGDRWNWNEAAYTIVTEPTTMGEHYVRINWWPRVCPTRINWWPHMAVSRKPDWSWMLSEHPYYYSSVPDTDKLHGTGPE